MQRVLECNFSGSTGMLVHHIKCWRFVRFIVYLYYFSVIFTAAALHFDLFLLIIIIQRNGNGT